MDKEPGKQIFIGPEVYSKLETLAQGQNVTVSEFVGQLIEGNSERQEQERNDEAAEPIETVNRTVTIKIAKEFDDFLQLLTKANGTTPEKYLAEELYGVLCSFYQGGHMERLLDPFGNRLDKLADQVWQQEP